MSGRRRGGRRPDRAGRGGAALARPLPAHRPRGPRRRRARLAARHAPPAHPARQGLGDVHGGEGVPAADRVPLPAARGGLPRAARRHGRPHRVFLDCGNIDRMPVEFLTRGRQLPHQHRPPPRQHPLRRRQPGRNRRLVHGGDRLRARAPARRQITPEIASALYVGLVTDTGKFMYENTNAGTHRIAADLIEAGVDVDDTYRRLYEHVPIEKLRLVSRALEGIERTATSRLVLTYVTDADYEATGAGEEMTEGIIDHLRSIEGAKVAALIRDRAPRPRRPQGQPALQRGRRRRLGDRPRARGRRAQARRRLLHRPRARGAGRVPLRRGRRPARFLSDGRPPTRARCCSATSRRG